MSWFSARASGRSLGKIAMLAFVLHLTVPAPAAPQLPLLSDEAAPRLETITSPVEEFGQELGSDYFLTTYTQLQAYWAKLSRESDRMVLDTLGPTEEGRPQLMAIITSPENHRNLDRYREIARRLALAEGVSEREARELAQEGKAIVWIDGGLHATEVLGAQQLMQLVYDMVSRTDGETLRFLDDVVLLAAHANPDGHELVSTWYMRHDDPLKRTTSGIPVLYEKYAGHDNNRDFYMAALKETQNIASAHYRVWFPQIIYNHHQTGPQGTVMFAPPFRDPPNHNLDPLILTSLDQVGSAMHQRMIKEGKGGTTMRSGASYSTWWNGGLRTTPYFHNMIGLLTETIGNPTPIEIPFIPRRQLPHGDLPLPVRPGAWHFKWSVDYSQTANRAVLDYASRNRDHLLFNIWRMGQNAIERGSRDHWTIRPSLVAAAADQLPTRGGRGGPTPTGSADDFERLLRDPANRDARGYVIPASQEDFPTATKFVNALIKFGVAVNQATADFEVAGKAYPEGSYVVKTAQAFRAHVIDMFEPQDHPNDFAYPGAPPTPPYDVAGWTLAYQMGVEFDRVLDRFDGPFRPIDDMARPRPGIVAGPAGAGYLLRHDANDAFIVVNRVIAAGGEVHWLTEETTAGAATYPPGTFYLPSGSGLADIVRTAAAELGVSFQGVARAPSAGSMELGDVRIGLADRYGGSMPSGWIRLMLEQFEFPFRVVFPPELNADGLHERYDVLIFPDGAIGGGGFGGGFGGPELTDADLPEQYRGRLGSVDESTMPQIRAFVERGGTVITIGSSTAMGQMLGLPISDHLISPATGQPYPSEEYYIPGSVLEIRIDGSSPLTHGLGDRLDVMFHRSPVFSVEPGAPGIRTLGWFDSPKSLRSGWAWGQEKLVGGAAIVEADIGSGKLFLLGPRVTFRSQMHGAFPLLFNGIHYGAAARRPVM